ncbi:MAG: hypothetical protein OZX49_02536 [Immundisolibacter sp.]|nr:hypothetical protein [Immundisolibacter sp.]
MTLMARPWNTGSSSITVAPRMLVSEVSTIGRRRSAQAVRMASRRVMPCASASRPNSMISSEARTTMPTRAMMPTIEAPENSAPMIRCPGNTPMKASGSAASATSGMANER